MPTETPTPPPEAVVIRLTREAANVTIPQAAKAARISTARWSQVEAGRETRNRVVRPVRGKARTIAHMAQAVGVSPERLESDGQRPDAAEILREILRMQAAAAESARDGSRLAAGRLAAVPDDADEDAVIEMLIANEPDDERRAVMEQAWNWTAIPRAGRLKMLRSYLEEEQGGEEPGGEERHRGAGS